MTYLWFWDDWVAAGTKQTLSGENYSLIHRFKRSNNEHKLSADFIDRPAVLSGYFKEGQKVLKKKKSTLSIYVTSNPFKLVIFLNEQARKETSNPCYTYLWVFNIKLPQRNCIILISSYLIWLCLLSLIDDQSLEKQAANVMRCHN